MIKLKPLTEIKKFDINRSGFVVDPRPMIKVKEFVDSLLKDLKQLQYELGFSNVRIHYVVQDRVALARYVGVIDKTVEPIITVSTRVLQRWARQVGKDLATEVETMLVHEFGHAYLEIHTGMSTSQQVKHSGPVEAAVVKFSEKFVEDRNIGTAKKILDDFIEDFAFDTGQITEEVSCPRCNGWKVVYVRAGIPNIIAKCPVCVDKPKTIKVYRGVSEGNKKYDNFWTTDKEWARQFTQSGLDKEIKQRTIDTSVIMKRENVPLPRATSDKDFDQAIKDAKFGKFDAFWVNEGQGEPPSIYVMNLAVLK
jgi:hypothetical protein